MEQVDVEKLTSSKSVLMRWINAYSEEKSLWLNTPRKKYRRQLGDLNYPVDFRGFQGEIAVNGPRMVKV